jgi:ornithine lipid ester-linked acyl 2-hydroxylase
METDSLVTVGGSPQVGRTVMKAVVRISRAVSRSGNFLVPWIETWIGRASLVGDKTFFEVADFPWAKRIEKDWPLIRRELDQVLQDREHLPNFHDILANQAALSDDDMWKTYYLYGYWGRVDANCERCPETARLCKEIPGMKDAFFSIISPHKHIKPHRGMYKGVLRYHLGLRIPEPKDSCRIRVRDDVRHWEEGKSLIFDDTFEHEVWNDTEGLRVVLFVDFVRPLPFPASTMNALVLKVITFRPFIRNAGRRELDWETRFEALKADRKPAAV